MPDDMLAQARALLAELTEAAKKGAIIPIRLPGQLEAIASMLDQAGESSGGQVSGTSPDIEDFLKDQSAFMSHAIHELRTPMTSIRGYSDMLSSQAMGPLTAMQEQFLGTIRTNARRMEGLLTDVSDISKIRAGTLKVAPKMDMFKNIALMVEKQTRPQAEELKRSLVFDIPTGLPLLNLDGELLAKALTKMVENALRYTPEERGEVKFSGTAAEGNRLSIIIEDNGVGMTPEDIQQLGTIYFRGDNDVVRNYKGSGLGIPIAYGIIDVLGGSVAVQSVPNQGTTFTVSFTGLS